MKYAVIDIGSNSVRLLINSDGASIFKEVKITKLAKDAFNGYLNGESIRRTVDAVELFALKAKECCVDNIFCFATAAIRNAKNKQDIIDEIFLRCGVDVDVISGEKEAMIGALGALSGMDGGVVDVGGASSEVCFLKQGEIVYSHSIPIGAVFLTDLFGQNFKESREYVTKKVSEYKKIDCNGLYAIGGTATTISAIEQGLEPYDRNKVHGYKIKRQNLNEITNKLFALSVDERRSLKGLQSERADVIAQGSLILMCIMEHFNVDCLTVSENDNLEGYLIERISHNE